MEMAGVNGAQDSHPLMSSRGRIVRRLLVSVGDTDAIFSQGLPHCGGMCQNVYEQSTGPL